MSAKRKSITRAADELMVTPAAVTMQIKQLEKFLDFKLLYRKGNAIRLTELGEKVFAASEAIFRQIEDMEAYLENISNIKIGNLRIGSHQTIAKYVLPQLISEFNSRHPIIKILLSTGTTNEIVKKLINHEIDLSITVKKPDEKGVEFKKIGSINILLIASAASSLVSGDKIVVNQLASLPFILREGGTSVRFIVNDFFKSFSIRPNIIMQLASHHLIKKFVSKDIGLSFLEEFAVVDELKSGELKAVRIHGRSPKIDLGICYLKPEILSPAADAFLKMIDDLTPQSDILFSQID